MMPSLMGRSNALRADMAERGRMVDATTTPVARRKSRFDGMNRFTGWMPFWVVKVIESKEEFNSLLFWRTWFQGW